jgi:hypothetical protein
MIDNGEYTDHYSIRVFHVGKEISFIKAYYYAKEIHIDGNLLKAILEIMKMENYELKGDEK